ncbi:hypothetical protein CTAM01_16507 [Colletotrichum tamarilloi]|uniref:Hsp70-like protein n=1 Tax=Colletotrichum tamarilloi TaxID=1209934 RepID=A0ABQ9QIH2_9PEZI|nr:uncharacterized protein CTAM01_16507 [Colletotrichum tamarilloi]KAK1471616.1 hypothetical protein CTAM01_16507 [Colletotrichum tamarilloi]
MARGVLLKTRTLPNAFAGRNGRRRDVVAAWDWGSTSVRLTICPLPTGDDEDIFEAEVLFNRNSLPTQDGTRYEKGSFSGFINISGRGEVYTGDEIGPSTTQVSAKFFLGDGFSDTRGGIATGTTFSEVNAALAEVNVLRQQILERQGDPDFMRRGNLGVKQILTAVLLRLESECHRKNKPLRVVDIGLSVPAHWTLREHERYRELIEEVLSNDSQHGSTPTMLTSRSFNLDDINDHIHFHTEAEAMAHFLCSDEDIANKTLGRNVSQYVLFIDFGGSSTNICLFFVRRRAGRTALFKAGNSIGMVGGSSMLETSVGNFCVDHTNFGGNQPTSSEHTSLLRNEFLRAFRWRLIADGLRNPFREESASTFEAMYQKDMDLSIDRPENYPSTSLRFHVTIPAANLNQMFHQAFFLPLYQACEGIKGLKKTLETAPKGTRGRIVVSGGGAKNQSVKHYLFTATNEIFESMSPPPIIFLDCLPETPWESFNTAKGAAIATAKANLSVASYITKGAAFGIQVQRGPGLKSEAEWDNEASVILGKTFGLIGNSKICISDSD